MALQWQLIEEVTQPIPGQPVGTGTWSATQRLELPMGWLVRTFAQRREEDQPPGGYTDVELAYSVAITFVPDPTKSWK